MIDNFRSNSHLSFLILSELPCTYNDMASAQHIFATERKSFCNFKALKRKFTTCRQFTSTPFTDNICPSSYPLPWLHRRTKYRWGSRSLFDSFHNTGLIDFLLGWNLGFAPRVSWTRLDDVESMGMLAFFNQTVEMRIDAISLECGT